MKITVKMDGLDAVQAKLRGLSDRKIRVAAKSALNVAARSASEATKREMRGVFDRPTPWVLGGVRYVKATDQKLEAVVDFDQWGNKTAVTVGHVLEAEIAGGNRKHKRHEVALQRAGILPAGYYIVPGDAAQIDAYGNMKGSQIVQIMAWFQSFDRYSGDNKNMTDKRMRNLGKDKRNGQRGFQYFALQNRRGGLPPGIYQRFTFAHGSAIKPVMIFVRSPAYRKRLDFYGVADRVARAEFNKAFSEYLGNMLKERGL